MSRSEVGRTIAYTGIAYETHISHSRATLTALDDGKSSLCFFDEVHFSAENVLHNQSWTACLP